ncbi:MAG: histidine kinase [Actinomycetes bacterium]
MSDAVGHDAVQVGRDRLPLLWRVFLINGLVFVTGTATLALSPATVSAPVSEQELSVLTAGLAVLLFANWILLRNSFAPLGRLIGLMDRVDILRPGERLPEAGAGDVSRLIRTFNAMLDRLEAERGASSAHAIVAQEAERHRIAQELHDEIGQSLTVVLLGLKRAADRAPEDLRDEIHQIQELARSSLDEVRHVARRLRPGELEDLGLASALAALATDLSRHIDTPVHRRICHDLPPLPPHVELVLYRVAQEALTNATRHAHARHLELSLDTQDGVVALRIADDGRGLGARPEGAGIRGMRERAIHIGARLDVHARVGGGTVVHLVLPAAQVGAP